jgi:hypothetical protein
LWTTFLKVWYFLITLFKEKDYKGTLWSPTHVLATQIGNSLEISNILASFLIGFGFRAFVVCGWVDEATSKMDRSQEACPMMMKEDVAVEADGSHLCTKYTPKKPPDLKSKYIQFLNKLKQDTASGKIPEARASVSETGSGVDLGGTEKVNSGHYFHSWIYIDMLESSGFFIESTTGNRKPLNNPAYKSINSVWNHENYWLNRQADEEWKTATSLDMGNNSKWIKFVCDMELPKKTGENSNEDSPKRLLNNLQGWLNDLVIPRDCFELMYRLGQRSAEFKNVNVESYAPYLLKDGMVQRVTQFQAEKLDQELDDDAYGEGESEAFEEEDLEESEIEGKVVDDEEEEEEVSGGEDTDDYDDDEEEEEEEEDEDEEEEEDEDEDEDEEEDEEADDDDEKGEEKQPAEDKMVVERPPPVVHVYERFRYRTDKMTTRETFPLHDKVIERFDHGRKDRLREHEFYKVGAAILGGEAEDVSKYYSSSRVDGLARRVCKDMELVEEYVGRPDHLIHMNVQFVHVEKKFGPAVDSTKIAREIGRIVETYEMAKAKKVGVNNNNNYDTGDKLTLSPGRVLDTVHGIMERTYDIDGKRILLKFHRERGQVIFRF